MGLGGFLPRVVSGSELRLCTLGMEMTGWASGSPVIQVAVKKELFALEILYR